jgi:hypothetical protein
VVDSATDGGDVAADHTGNTDGLTDADNGVAATRTPGEAESGATSSSPETQAIIDAKIDEGKTFAEDGAFDANGDLKKDAVYTSGEYGDYVGVTDSQGRLVEMQVDDLHIKDHDGRLDHNPNTPDKQQGDHAGHLIGDRFGGSPELDNLVSQLSSVNLSDFKKIENSWARALNEGKPVSVDIKVVYDGTGARPTRFDVEYTIDGDLIKKMIPN